MKRGFVRVLWGDDKIDISDKSYIDSLIDRKIHLPNEHNLIRRQKVARDINKCMSMNFLEPFTVYVFGKRNFDIMREKNINAVLVDDEPYRYYCFGHKIAALEYAMNDFDEIVLMDWDTKPCKKYL